MEARWTVHWPSFQIPIGAYTVLKFDKRLVMIRTPGKATSQSQSDVFETVHERRYKSSTSDSSLPVRYVSSRQTREPKRAVCVYTLAAAVSWEFQISRAVTQGSVRITSRCRLIIQGIWCHQPLIQVGLLASMSAFISLVSCGRCTDNLLISRHLCIQSSYLAVIFSPLMLLLLMSCFW